MVVGQRYFLGIYGGEGDWATQGCSYSYAVDDAEYDRIMREGQRMGLPETSAESTELPLSRTGMLILGAGAMLSTSLALRLRRRRVRS